MPQFPIDTARCTLREFTRDDVAGVQSYATDDATVRFLPWGPNTEAQTTEYLERCIGYQADTPRRFWELAVLDRAEGAIIGAAGLRVIRPDAAEGEVGYVLRRDRWGQGLMPEVVQALLRVGFTTLALHRISATTDPQNIASGRVLEKCGFRLEGCLRDHTRSKGVWRNALVYGLLVDEWRAGVGSVGAA